MKKSASKILKDWEVENGRCWVKEIQMMAEQGKTWSDVSAFFGVEETRLRAAAYYIGVKFNLKRRVAKTRHWSGQVPNYYWYQGRRWTLKELSEFSGIKHTTIYCRIHQKSWTVARAVETPVMTKSQAGQLGWEAVKNEQATTPNRAQANRPTHAAHGL